jgi:uncharacterized protein (DUF1697 family)
MTTYIALLRGVNVGGHNRLPMKVLVSTLTPLGYTNVRTYIQSGNIRFDTRETEPAVLAETIRNIIHTEFGLSPFIKVIKSNDFQKIVTQNPFPGVEVELEGRSLHVFFMDRSPDRVDAAKLDELKQSYERWQIVGKALYLYVGEGFHKSQLALRLESILRIYIRGGRDG